MSKESYNPDQLDGISLTIKDFVKVKKVGEDAASALGRNGKMLAL